MIGVPKDPEYRNRALLDLAHRDDAECGNCGYVGPCDPAHSNWMEDGKGKSHKAHDCYFAFLCARCHAWLDQASVRRDPTDTYPAERLGKHEMWMRAFKRTVLFMWRRGWIRVV